MKSVREDSRDKLIGVRTRRERQENLRSNLFLIRFNQIVFTGLEPHRLVGVIEW